MISEIVLAAGVMSGLVLTRFDRQIRKGQSGGSFESMIVLFAGEWAAVLERGVQPGPVNRTPR